MIRATALLAICSALSFAAEPDYSKMKLEWTERFETLRKQHQDASDTKIAELEAKITEANGKIARADKKTKAKLQTEIATMTMDKNRITSNRNKWSPSMPHITEAKEGYFGRLSETVKGPPQFKVSQVIDANSLIADWGGKSYLLITKTSGIADDDIIKVDGFVHLDGTVMIGGRTLRKVVLVP